MKSLVLVAIALVLGSTTVRAEGGVNLFVGDCSAGARVKVASDVCTANNGTAFIAHASCIVPAVTHPAVIRVQGVLDVQTSEPTIPDWWRGDACRATGFVLAADATMGGSCPVLWTDVPLAGAMLNAVTSSRPDRMRFLLTADIASPGGYDLVGDGVTEWSVFRLTILNSNSNGPGACAGCSYGACVVLNEINFQGLGEAPDAWLRVTSPVVSNYIAYNANTPLCPASTPALNHTWGALKSLYR